MDNSLIDYKKIRLIRRSKKLSLGTLATLTDLSTSYLSQVERGLVNPSLSALGNIAEALGIKLTSLFMSESTEEKGEYNFSVIHPDKRHRLFYPGSSIANEMLTPKLNEEFEFFWTTIPAGGESRSEPYAHIGYECGVIIQGTVEFQIGNEVVVLQPGFSISFDSTIPHSWKNIGDCEVHAVWVITPSPFSNKNRNNV